MWIFGIATVVEGLTGLAFLLAPQLVAGLLLGVGLDGGGAAIGRLGGVALICLALACCPERGAVAPAVRRAMLLLQPAMALSLMLIALVTGLGGILLWPAVILHTDRNTLTRISRDA
jgi:hypothetical protein